MTSENINNKPMKAIRVPSPSRYKILSAVGYTLNALLLSSLVSFALSKYLLKSTGLISYLSPILMSVLGVVIFKFYFDRLYDHSRSKLSKLQNFSVFKLRYSEDYRYIFVFFATFSATLGSHYYLVSRYGLNPEYAPLVSLFLLIPAYLLILYLPWDLTLYLFFGVLTTLVSLISFSLSDMLLNFTALGGETTWFIPQSISFVLAVSFAYFTNRRYVFQSKGAIFSEFLRFISSRVLASAVFEFLGLWLLVDLFLLNKDLSKLISAILVVIANWILSKYFIFQDEVGSQEANFVKNTK